MDTTIEQWLSRGFNPMGEATMLMDRYDRAAVKRVLTERDDVRELAWDLLRRCGCLDGDLIKPMLSGTLTDACDYFEQIGWLEKVDDRTYKNIRHKGDTDA